MGTNGLYGCSSYYPSFGSTTNKLGTATSPQSIDTGLAFGNTLQTDTYQPQQSSGIGKVVLGAGLTAAAIGIACLFPAVRGKIVSLLGGVAKSGVADDITKGISGAVKSNDIIAKYGSTRTQQVISELTKARNTSFTKEVEKLITDAGLSKDAVFSAIKGCKTTVEAENAIKGLLAKDKTIDFSADAVNWLKKTVACNKAKEPYRNLAKVWSEIEKAANHTARDGEYAKLTSLKELLAKEGNSGLQTEIFDLANKGDIDGVITKLKSNADGQKILDAWANGKTGDEIAKAQKAALKDWVAASYYHKEVPTRMKYLNTALQSVKELENKEFAEALVGVTPEQHKELLVNLTRDCITKGDKIPSKTNDLFSNAFGDIKFFS